MQDFSETTSNTFPRTSPLAHASYPTGENVLAVPTYTTAQAPSAFLSPVNSPAALLYPNSQNDLTLGSPYGAVHQPKQSSPHTPLLNSFFRGLEQEIPNPLKTIGNIGDAANNSNGYMSAFINNGESSGYASPSECTHDLNNEYFLGSPLSNQQGHLISSSSNVMFPSPTPTQSTLGSESPDIGSNSLLVGVPTAAPVSNLYHSFSPSLAPEFELPRKTTAKTRRTRNNRGRIHECGVCGKAFKRVESLEVHIRQHQSGQPFECGVCGKGFNKSNVLKRHEATHQQVKRFVCYCGRGFSRQDAMNRHYRAKMCASTQLSI